MMKAVVLCGGESKRMGSDKGLLPIGTDTWAQHAFRKLQALNIPVLVSLNKTQVSAYRQHFSDELLIIDQVAAKGPLTGLLSAHLNHPGDDLLLLACDMTEMDTDTLQYLKDSTTAFPRYDYYVYTHEDFLEPLCAVYTSGCLRKILDNLKNNNLSNFSLHKLIKQGNYKALPVKDIRKFNNHNSDRI